MLIYLFITLDYFFFVQIGISKGLFFQPKMRQLLVNYQSLPIN